MLTLLRTSATLRGQKNLQFINNILMMRWKLKLVQYGQNISMLTFTNKAVNMLNIKARELCYGCLSL